MMTNDPVENLTRDLKREFRQEGYARLEQETVEMTLPSAEFCDTADQLVDKICGDLGKVYVEEQPEGGWVLANTRRTLNQHSNA